MPESNTDCGLELCGRAEFALALGEGVDLLHGGEEGCAGFFSASSGEKDAGFALQQHLFSRSGGQHDVEVLKGGGCAVQGEFGIERGFLEHGQRAESVDRAGQHRERGWVVASGGEVRSAFHEKVKNGVGAGGDGVGEVGVGFHAFAEVAASTRAVQQRLAVVGMFFEETGEFAPGGLGAPGFEQGAPARKMDDVKLRIEALGGVVVGQRGCKGLVGALEFAALVVERGVPRIFADAGGQRGDLLVEIAVSEG